MILATLMIGLIVTLLIGVPIAWALGLSSLFAILLMDLPLHTIPQKVISGMEMFTLLCIPLFILAGEIMGKGGLTKRLLDFAVATVGFIRGGLALANVIASMFFGGISGSSNADASALGAVEIPMMVKNGYDPGFSAAVTAASANIGNIIPPSIPVVVYAMAVGGTSIGGLFAAGMIPGIFVGVALMVACYVISRKRNYPKREQKITVKQFLILSKDALLALMAPVIILGGIIGGIFTPTEAAGVAVFYCFFVTYFIFRELRLSDLPGMFLRAAATTAVVMIIIGTANVFGMVVAFEQVSLKLERIVQPLGLYSFILAVNIIFLFLGTFMDANPCLLIVAPVLAPIAVSLGIHPIHFGLIVITNLVIGHITPPLGAILFIVAPLANVSFEEVIKEVFPFLLVQIGVLLCISYFPFFTLFIPKLLGYVT